MTVLIFDTDSTITEATVRHAQAKGIGAILPYLGARRNLTAAAARLISAAGIRIGSLSERHGAKRMLVSADGEADGAADRALAEAVGQPYGTAIISAADFDATEDEDEAVMTYQAGYQKGLGPYDAAIYGNGAICRLAKARGLAEYDFVAGGSGMRGTAEYKTGWTLKQDVGDRAGIGIPDIDSGTAATLNGWSWSLSDQSQPAPQKSVAITPVLTRELRLGVAPGDDVAQLQERLVIAGYRVVPNRIFGVSTDAAVRAFQKQWQLVIDGIVAPAVEGVPHSGETWQALWR